MATGSWRETTSPDGYYKGVTYHGTLQMVVDPSGRHMRGMWLGFSRDFTIKSGEWELTWQEASTAKSTQRRYHAKVVQPSKAGPVMTATIDVPGANRPAATRSKRPNIIFAT